MSGRSVAEDLEYIRTKIGQHDELLVRMVELQERQVAQGDRLNEHIERSDKRMDKIEEKVDKVSDTTKESIAKAHTRIDDNKNQITRWSGGIAALIGLVGIAAAIWRMLPSN